jgi:hypothetical protein
MKEGENIKKEKRKEEETSYSCHKLTNEFLPDFN